MKRLAFSMSILAFGALPLLSSCGNSPQGGPSNPTDFTTSYADAVCQTQVKCGFLAASDLAGCETSLGMIPMSYSLSAAVTAGTASYDAGAAGRCIDDVNGASCIQIYAVAGSGGASLFPNDCGQVFSGKAANGGTCKSDADCANGWCADKSGNPVVANGCSGTCKPFLPNGTVCMANDQCGPASQSVCNFVIDSSGNITQSCANLGGSGASCGGNYAPCQPGMNCVLTSEDSMGNPIGTCQGPGGAGAACTTALVFPLLADTCGKGLACDAKTLLPNTFFEFATGTCQPLAASGAQCKVGDGCQDGLLCKGWSASVSSSGTSFTITPGTCASPLATGATCSASAAVNGCLLSNRCDMTKQVCVAPGAAGGTCDPSGQNGPPCDFGLYCSDAGKCTAFSTYGGACTVQKSGNDPCIDGTCDTTGHCSLVCM